MTSLNATPAEKGKLLEIQPGSDPPPPYSSPKSILLLPFARGRQFIGRESDLGSTKEAFTAHRRVAISGMGGIG